MKRYENYCKIGYNMKIGERYQATNKCIKARETLKALALKKTAGWTGK